MGVAGVKLLRRGIHVLKNISTTCPQWRVLPGGRWPGTGSVGGFNNGHLTPATSLAISLSIINHTESQHLLSAWENNNTFPPGTPESQQPDSLSPCCLCERQGASRRSISIRNHPRLAPCGSRADIPLLVVGNGTWGWRAISLHAVRTAAQAKAAIPQSGILICRGRPRRACVRVGVGYQSRPGDDRLRRSVLLRALRGEARRLRWPAESGSVKGVRNRHADCRGHFLR